MSSSVLCVFVVLLMHTCMTPCEAANVDVTPCTNGGTECSGIVNAVCDLDTTPATPMCKCATYAPQSSTTCAATACSAASTCTAIDPNSECSGTTSSDKCRCKTGYSLSTAGLCQQDVTSTVCTSTGTECSAIDNARCDTTALKCKCGSISAMIANTCTGKACTASTTCTAMDANSECSGTAAGSVCRCKTGYLMGTDGICAIQCIIDTTCTLLDANSKCSGTSLTSMCKCNTGYTMGIDGKCASGAATVLVSMTMLFACFLARLL